MKRIEKKKNQLLEIQALGKIYKGLNITSKTVKESEDGEVLIDELKKVTMKINFKPSLYKVQEGDVIVFSRGNNIKVAVIPSHEGMELLSQNFIGIHPKSSSVNPYFLQAYLESPIGQYQLSSLMEGSTIPVLNQKLLGVLEILVPVSDVQKAAALQYKEAKERYKDIISKAKRRQWMNEKVDMY